MSRPKNGTMTQYADGSKAWHLDGELHRIDGSAIEKADGTKMWYLDGKCHRIDGPAVEWSDGFKEWWLDGELYSEEEHFWMVLSDPRYWKDDDQGVRMIEKLEKT